jgi:hypothetical protein
MVPFDPGESLVVTFRPSSEGQRCNDDIWDLDLSYHRLLLESHFTDTNGTDEPGTIVVGSTPFQRSACTPA